jgi:hypothetical protein
MMPAYDMRTGGRSDNKVATVFISHRGADSRPAQRLADALKAAGHQVWLDTWSIRLGDSIVARMDEGLESAAYVVVCYSSEPVTAPTAQWMSREWMSALARQLDGHGVRLLPVLLTGRQIPALLADLKYADLVADWDRGVAELLRAIR